MIDKQKILKTIVKECYWDYNVDVDDLKEILENKDKRENKKLFDKIIYNSHDKLQALQLFSRQQQKEFLNDFKVTYNEKYITRHLLVLKSLLLNELTYIKGLEWKQK